MRRQGPHFRDVEMYPDSENEVLGRSTLMSSETFRHTGIFIVKHFENFDSQQYKLTTDILPESLRVSGSEINGSEAIGRA